MYILAIEFKFAREFAWHIYNHHLVFTTNLTQLHYVALHLSLSRLRRNLCFVEYMRAIIAPSERDCGLKPTGKTVGLLNILTGNAAQREQINVCVYLCKCVHTFDFR